MEEAFAARRPARRLLVVPERRGALDALVVHATTVRIPVVEVEGGTLTSIAGFDGHQGVALVTEPRVWATLEDILARASERREAPLILVLDSLEDPQNVGTLLRTAEACGVHGVVFPTRRAAPLTPAAVKASAGAVEHLLIAPVDDLPGSLVDLHGRGLRLVGADEDASMAYRDADLRGPLGLIVGSEGRGVSAPVRRRLDLSVRIPMHGRIASLNAAVAGSVLLFEATGQRGGTPARAPSDPATAAPRRAQPVVDERADATTPSDPAATAADAAADVPAGTVDQPKDAAPANEAPLIGDRPDSSVPADPRRDGAPPVTDDSMTGPDRAAGADAVTDRDTADAPSPRTTPEAPKPRTASKRTRPSRPSPSEPAGEDSHGGEPPGPSDAAAPRRRAPTPRARKAAAPVATSGDAGAAAEDDILPGEAPRPA